MKICVAVSRTGSKHLSSKIAHETNVCDVNVLVTDATPFSRVVNFGRLFSARSGRKVRLCPLKNNLEKRPTKQLSETPMIKNKISILLS